MRMVLPERTGAVRMPVRMSSLRMPERMSSLRIPPMAPQPAVRQAVAPVPYTGICYVPLPQYGPPSDPASFAEGEVAGEAKLDVEGHGHQLTPADLQAHQTSLHG